MRRPLPLLCLGVALLPNVAAAKPKPQLPPPVAVTDPQPASACADCQNGAPLVAGSEGADFLAAFGLASARFEAATRVIDANGNGGADLALTPTTDVFVTGAAGSRDGWVLGWSNPGRAMVQRFDGAGTPSGTAVRANDPPLGDNHGTAVAAGAGRVLVTFDANRSGLPTVLMGQLFDELLGRLGGALELGPSSPHAPTVACFRPDGSAVVAWTTWIPPEVPGGDAVNGVALRVIGADGVPRGPVQTLARPQLRVTVSPAIACTAGNGYVVAWHSDQKPQANKSWEVVAQWVDERGKKRRPVRLNLDRNGDQLRPALLELSDGSVLAVWESASGGATKLVGRRFSATGQPRSAEFVLHTPAPGTEARSPRLTLMPGTGRFVLAWQESGRGWVQVFHE